jgi:hypothetical protein
MISWQLPIKKGLTSAGQESRPTATIRVNAREMCSHIPDAAVLPALQLLPPPKPKKSAWHYLSSSLEEPSWRQNTDSAKLLFVEEQRMRHGKSKAVWNLLSSTSMFVISKFQESIMAVLN